MGPIYAMVSTTIYATFALGQFTEEEDGENRSLVIFRV